MSEQDLKEKTEKFLFDLNNFDDDFNAEDEFEEPPPPTFSEEELTSAKTGSYQEGYNKGRQEALDESAKSREQFVAQQLEIIAQSLPQIFDKEKKRENTYEAEAVSLTLHIFEKLFPVFQEKHGFEELKHAMADILQKQAGKKEINIKVHPDTKDGIQDHLKTLSAQGIDLNLNIEGDEGLDQNVCRMDWGDGGAVKDPQALSYEILELVKDTLAAPPTTRHDVEIEAELQDADTELPSPDALDDDETDTIKNTTDAPEQEQAPVDQNDTDGE